MLLRWRVIPLLGREDRMYAATDVDALLLLWLRPLSADVVSLDNLVNVASQITLLTDCSEFGFHSINFSLGLGRFIIG